MLNRHELPPLLPALEIKDVQTSVLTEAIKQHLAHAAYQFTISEVLSDWLQMDPVKVTMDQQIRVGAILQSLGCFRIRTKYGVIYLPPDEALPSPDYQRRGEPLNTADPFPLFEFGPWSAVITASLLAAAGVGIVLGLIAIGSWVHAGMAILPLGQTWGG